jgi:prepilin-type N-terminal cleavage/methylation domain-containing protein/prepilin-type processing-associated H-X9-DG protein
MKRCQSRCPQEAQGFRRGFTLVELLVVVAVMAVLAGLLLPALGRARRAGSGARCVSNLHQYALAAHLYWDDSNGRAFPERGAYSRGGWQYWFGWLEDGEEGRRTFIPEAGCLWRYLGARPVAWCPSLDRASARFKAKADGAASGYAYNQLLGPRDGPVVRVSQLASPGEVAVFADAAQVNDFQPPATPEQPLLEEFYYFGTNRLEATIHFRHGERAQAAYADGHVGAERVEVGSLDDRVPGHRVGRIRPERVVPR